MSEVAAAMDSGEADPETATAAARRASYKNTMLGGSIRKVPVCLADGEYLFSTEFQNADAEAPTTYGPYSAAASAFSVGGRHFYESQWTFCGYTGMLSEYTHILVADGLCTPILGWGETAAPAVTPITGITPAPTPADVGENPDNTGGENRSGGGGDEQGDESTGGDQEALSELAIFGIGFGALIVAGGAAAGGTYAQNKGWFAAGGGAAGAAAAGAGGGAPNPDSDEFAP